MEGGEGGGEEGEEGVGEEEGGGEEKKVDWGMGKREEEGVYLVFMTSANSLRKKKGKEGEWKERRGRKMRGWNFSSFRPTNIPLSFFLSYLANSKCCL